MSDRATFQPVRSSPLAGLPEPFGGFELRALPFEGKIELRGDPSDESFESAVDRILVGALPVNANTVTRANDYAVFWLGPDEWRLHCPDNDRYELFTQFQEAFDGCHAALVDVSDYYVGMRLSGAKTLEVLSKGTSLDLHPRAFEVGRCAQTRFGHATVLLHKLEAKVVDLQVRWSFAEYVWRYLVDGSREYRS